MVCPYLHTQRWSLAFLTSLARATRRRSNWLLRLRFVWIRDQKALPTSHLIRAGRLGDFFPLQNGKRVEIVVAFETPATHRCIYRKTRAESVFDFPHLTRTADSVVSSVFPTTANVSIIYALKTSFAHRRICVKTRPAQHFLSFLYGCKRLNNFPFETSFIY